MSVERELQIGDVVTLKSGGPKMTIENIGLYSYEKTESAKCSWFEGTKEKSALFKLTSLKLADS